MQKIHFGILAINKYLDMVDDKTTGYSVSESLYNHWVNVAERERTKQGKELMERLKSYKVGA
ncbi:MAG: hypothetical protein US20_C0005G0035 [Candidatus Pacebacteria bacterium GW2011_GWF1_36_5]|nr:MAG: hypothetical protein US20_C0005G0035 [Candidatus Pacebacteria bacterium GW2011_GWF1_36_5]